MKMGEVHSIYFLGIGGIGMSALARYFNDKGCRVAGYDRTRSELTAKLEAEGMSIHYNIDPKNLDAEWDLVVYTPAIPAVHAELAYAKEKGLAVMKRSELLGLISKDHSTIAVAGTHGKTTTSTILADILVRLGADPLVFLGGIHAGWKSNYRSGKGPLMVTEADEFDRSFLHLHPYYSILNSVDADHLDIYHDPGRMLETYKAFLKGHPEGAKVLVQEEVLKHMDLEGLDHVDLLTFGYSELNDYRLLSTELRKGQYWMRWSKAGETFEVQCGLPGRHNAMNTLGALALVDRMGCDLGAAQEVVAEFEGIHRRFEVRYSDHERVIIDDYAHHPNEVKAAITAARESFPGYKLKVVFQAHLYSRTRDFMKEFAEALSVADVLFTCEIYPAREEPIDGITGEALFDKVEAKEKYYRRKKDLPDIIDLQKQEVLLVLGAGNIDSIIDEVIEKIGA
jgi:UDP-N-acetylmuramate--alanine ligase